VQFFGGVKIDAMYY